MHTSAARHFEQRLRFSSALPTIAPEELRPSLVIRQTLQRRGRVRRMRFELAALALVLLVGLFAAWAIAPRVDVSLSGIVQTTEALGFVRSGTAPRHIVGYDADANVVADDLDDVSRERATLAH